MLKKATPGAKKEHLDKMMEWVRKEEEIIEKGVINYKMPKHLNARPKGNKTITFRQLKDYLHIFAGLDKDQDQMLTFEDFKSNYSHILTDKDFEAYFHKFNKTKADKLDLDEYLMIMLPQGSKIGKHHTYLYRLVCEEGSPKIRQNDQYKQVPIQK